MRSPPTPVEAGKAADLIVVGTRGRGGIAGMILGSTSQGILHNTQVPVMIVPQIEDPRIEQAPDAGVTWG